MEPEKPGFSKEVPSVPGAEPQHSYIPTPPKRKKNKVAIVAKVLVGLLVLAALAGGAYFVLFKKKDTPVVTAPPPTDSTPQSVSSEPQHFASADAELKVQFDHPGNWDVKATTDRRITVDTSTGDFEDFTGKAIKAKVIVQFRNKRAQITELSGTGHVTAQTSEKLTYDAPTTVQRAETFLTFVQGESGEGVGRVFVTGDKNFKKSVPITATDLAEVDPTIDIAFYQGETPVDITYESWQTSSLAQAVKDMLRSMKIN